MIILGKPRAEDAVVAMQLPDGLRPEGARQQDQHKKKEHDAFHNNKDTEKRIINKDQRRLDGA